MSTSQPRPVTQTVERGLLEHYVKKSLAASVNYDDTRSITETSGALAVAGIRNHVAKTGVQGQTWVAINSGANINFGSLRHVAERVAAQEPI